MAAVPFNTSRRLCNDVMASSSLGGYAPAPIECQDVPASRTAGARSAGAAHGGGTVTASRPTPELPRGQPRTLGQGGELQPGHAGMDVVEPDAGGGEAAVGARDDVVASHDPSEPDDALGDELGVLHEVGGVADDAGDQDHSRRRLELFEHVVLVLVARVGRLERERPRLDP